MKPRPSLVVCLVLALLGWCLAGDVSGPEPRAATSNTAPVQVGAVAYPSPVASPVAQGKVDRLTTDGTGLLWTRIVGSVAATLASGNVSVSNITTGNLSAQGQVAHDSAASGAGAPLLLGATAEDTLPTAVTEADVVRLSATSQGQIRAILDSSGNSTGYSWYCNPSLAGGSTEVTVDTGAGLVTSLSCSSPNTVDTYILGWDASNPTPGTTAPLFSFCVPGGTGSSNRAIYDFSFPEPGLQYTTALTITAVTTANGSTAPASAVTVNLGYR